MYPIRVNRPMWCQAFLKPHTCTELCNTQYEITDNIIRILYRTGCLFPDKIEPIFIHISNHGSSIDYLDVEVNIPPETTLVIDFPLRVKVERQIQFQQTPIKMSHILSEFDRIYQEIYKEEEEKASRREFRLNQTCPDCDEEKYTEEYVAQYLTPVNPETIDEEVQCNICFESGPDLFRINTCQHCYHKECILKWFNTPRVSNDEEEQQKSNSCPMCRQPIIFCSTCKATCLIQVPFFGVVPPYDADGEEDRIETDGPYRIHTLYYEELYFKGIMYNRLQNTICLLPFERVDDVETQET
jgi:hypothetical protein